MRRERRGFPFAEPALEKCPRTNLGRAGYLFNMPWEEHVAQLVSDGKSLPRNVSSLPDKDLRTR